MDAPDTQHEGAQDPRPASPTDKASIRHNSKAGRIIELLKHWAAEHTSEIVWACVFAVLAGYAFALYIEEPKPYKIYVVADPDTDKETLEKNFRTEERKVGFARIGNVEVKVQIEMLEQDKEAATKRAEELVGRPDTLLVIQHGRSQHVENSLPTYFGARPQVPLIATAATDDDLLTKCSESCFDEGWFDSVQQSATRFVPLLQLSPTNEVQGRSAVQFGSQSKKRRFLVVLGSDPADQSYTNNMVKAYSDAVHAAHAELVGVRRMDALPSESDLQSLKPDCVLYAGGVGEAQTLFTRLSSMKLTDTELMVILSDSVIQSRGIDSDLAVFSPTPIGYPVRPPPVVPAAIHELLPVVRPNLSPDAAHGVSVNFTYQTDAADYNSHTNTYAEDAFSIALQLISDLNQRGGDFRFRVKSFLHMHNVKDVRRNLVSIMKQNSSSRTWYKSASGERPYVFEGHKQYAWMFHVWQVRKHSVQPGSEMDDVDGWHPPRTAAVE